MPVPNDVIFGPNALSGELTYGAVRQLPEEDQLGALRRRLDGFFISQVDELAKPEGASSKVYSPFPLFLMTCVALETLGKVFFARLPKKGQTQEDIQREGFLRSCNLLHKHFSRSLNMEQKRAYDALWGANAHKHADTPSLIIYRLGRHTMIHGFQGRGIFITEDIEEWKMDKGSVIINPFWLWRSFKRAYEVLWEKLHANKNANNPLKRATLYYLDELLK